MRHYILVEVTHENPTRASSMIGDIRKEIHRVSESMDGNVADVVVRADRPFLPGFLTAYKTERSPYKETVDVFHKAMGSEWSKRREAKDEKAAAAARVKDLMQSQRLWMDSGLEADLRTLTEPPF